MLDKRKEICYNIIVGVNYYLLTPLLSGKVSSDLLGTFCEAKSLTKSKKYDIIRLWHKATSVVIFLFFALLTD